MLRMDEYRYSYTMSMEASKKVFKNTCKTIEKSLKGLKKEKLLMDIDGSLVRTYYFDGEEIAVYNCNKISCVYVESNVDLGEILGRESVY
ncbi:MAG: hypothetical protein IJ306_07145 [Oscillospiraceae bacterium]|nr:hypothetical protein [Oscillospiraceae bacterium]